MELGLSDGLRKSKVCVIAFLGSDFGIFLLDLSNCDAKKLVDIKPNFRVIRDPGSSLRFYVVNATAHILFNNFSTRDAPEVYSLNLSSSQSQSQSQSQSEAVLAKSDLQKSHVCFGTKSLPEGVGYRGTILLFSTAIAFHREGEENRLIDFEIFDPEGRLSRKLPQLLVCYNRVDLRFKLFDSRESKYSEPFLGRTPKNMYLLKIVSFCVDEDEDRFIIKTDIGKMFSLKLGDGCGSDDGYWRFCDEEEGYNFRSFGNNILTSDGVCLDAFGAHDYRRRWLRSRPDRKGDGSKRAKFAAPSHSQYRDGDGDGRSRYVEFPLRSIHDDGLEHLGGNYSYSISNHKDDGDSCTPCIVRIALDRKGYLAQSSHNLYMYLDVLRLNLKEELPEDKFVKRIMSFKFMVTEMIFQPNLAGVFYY